MMVTVLSVLFLFLAQSWQLNFNVCEIQFYKCRCFGIYIIMRMVNDNISHQQKIVKKEP